MGPNPTADRLIAALNANMLAARFGWEESYYDSDRLARENPCRDWLPSWLSAFVVQVTKALT